MPPSPRRRSSRSRSPGPSVRPRRDYAPSSWRDYVPVSWRNYLPLSFRDSPDVYAYPPSSATANTAQPSTSQRYAIPRNCPSPVSPIPQPFPRPGGHDSNLVQATTTAPSVSDFSVRPPSLPNHSGSTHHFRLSPPENTGMFYQPRDCTVTGTFVDASNVTYNASSNSFMKELLAETIRGAAHDSSARDPPPRCQSGTRLAILERCMSFIHNCNGVQKMRWIVGTAGVGKSAIMQSVAESPDLPGGPPASVFFSINGRDDGNKTITTLCYQLAAKHGPYRQVIEQKIILDPSLLLSSMEKQFKKLIVEPLVQNAQPDRVDRVPIIIDGLDECKNPGTQLELLRLISDLCLKNPSSPLVWLIASRPEPHITSFFSEPDIISAYEKEEVPIDSDEARADVERFLRVELMKIKHRSDSLDPQWPQERDFWKVTNAAGGLFAYAQTVINYIGDRRVGSPASQLSDVLCVIDKVAMTGLSRTEHPLALLDALYERILSNVPDKIMINTRKLLIALTLNRDSSKYVGHIHMNFLILCNWLGMTANEVYAAVHHLRSVLYVPRRDKAYEENLRSFHKSFTDYISDFTRSGLFSLDESYHLQAECSSRILTHSPDGIRSSSSHVHPYCDTMSGRPIVLDTPITWHVETLLGRPDIYTRLNLCKLAAEDLLNGMERGDRNFWSASCICFLASAWSFYGPEFPYGELLNAAFDETRRPEFMMHGILKHIPLEAVSENGIIQDRDIKFHFSRPTSMVTNSYKPQTPSCRHEWKAGNAGDWTTIFQKNITHLAVMEGECASCSNRLEDQLRLWKTRSPDHTALVMFTSSSEYCVQVRFVNPDDGMSEWTYSFWCSLSQDVREKYGSNI